MAPKEALELVLWAVYVVLAGVSGSVKRLGNNYAWPSWGSGTGNVRRVCRRRTVSLADS